MTDRRRDPPVPTHPDWDLASVPGRFDIDVRIRKPTQSERLRRLIARLDPEKMKLLADRLDEVLAEAQNQPPEGGSDGSISATEWKWARALADAVRKAAIFRGMFT